MNSKSQFFSNYENDLCDSTCSLKVTLMPVAISLSQSQDPEDQTKSVISLVCELECKLTSQYYMCSVS